MDKILFEQMLCIAGMAFMVLLYVKLLPIIAPISGTPNYDLPPPADQPDLRGLDLAPREE